VKCLPKRASEAKAVQHPGHLRFSKKTSKQQQKNGKSTNGEEKPK
jgi:hypothetical protein